MAFLNQKFKVLADNLFSFHRGYEIQTVQVF